MNWKKFFTGLALRLSNYSTLGLARDKASSIESAISSIRLSTYKNASPHGSGLEVYLWNANIAGVFLFPLHICEITMRNAAANALAHVYGPNWPWEKGFIYSLRKSKGGYSPRSDLINVAKKAQSAAQVIPELKFVFWQNLFTQSFENDIWNKNLPAVIHNVPSGYPIPVMREHIYGLLRDVRLLRNRIAHHEPLINRNLMEDYGKILSLIGYVSQETAEWVDDNQMVATCIANRPARQPGL